MIKKEQGCLLNVSWKLSFLSYCMLQPTLYCIQTTSRKSNTYLEHLKYRFRAQNVQHESWLYLILLQSTFITLYRGVHNTLNPHSPKYLLSSALNSTTIFINFLLCSEFLPCYNPWISLAFLLSSFSHLDIFSPWVYVKIRRVYDQYIEVGAIVLQKIRKHFCTSVTLFGRTRKRCNCTLLDDSYRRKEASQLFGQ